MLRSFSLLICFTIIQPASTFAHDFWIEPADFHLDTPGETTLAVQTGHGDEQHAWPLQAHRVVSLRSIGPGGIADQRANNHFENSAAPANIELSTPGLHIVAIESHRAFSELPSEKFDDYVAEEGLLSVAAHRKITQAGDAPGREVYSRVGKSLIQVGPENTATSKHMLTQIGSALEITPLNDFLAMPSENMQFQVSWQGRPLSGAKVHIIRLDQTAAEQSVLTNGQGQLTVPNPDEGDWFLHTVWGEPADGLLMDADYTTVFSSLSFSLD